MTRWNKVYTNRTHVYGKLANGLLWQHLQEALAGPVLDVGCGEGRNGLMAARMGRPVVGLDVSSVAVERACSFAAEEGLLFQGTVGDVLTYEYGTGTYAAVVAALVLPFVRKSQIVGLMERWRDATLPGGLVYVSALLSTDPDAAPHRGKCDEVEPWCFWKPELGEHRTFFEPGEVWGMLETAGYEVVEYLEGAFLEVTPAEGPHHHRQVQAVGRVRS